MPGLPRPGPTMPAAVATDNQGSRAKGLIMASLAVKVMEQAVPLFGAGSDEGQALLKSLTAMAKFVTPPSADVTQAELKLMGAQAPAAPSGPGNVVDIQSRLAKYGLGGMAA